jgi:hypothetical protein
MSEIIGLTLDADTSAIIAKLNNLENRYGRLERIAADTGKAKTKAFQDSAAAGEKMNRTLGESSSVLSKIGSVAAGLGVAAAIYSFGNSALEATKSMQGMEAAFTTAFSSEGVKAPLVAKAYMRELSDISKETPFAFEELSKAMLKLTTVDYTPAKKEITALGDLASAKNKGIDQLSEGILDAQQGSFERLKEFSIDASKSGDKVKFTFNGITTVVDNNKTAIRNAIIEMGKYEGIAGGMELQAKTLGGQLSNLGDSLFQLGAKIGEKLSPEINKGIQGFANFISSLDVDAIFEFFEPISNNLLPAIENLYKSLVETAKVLTGSKTEGELMTKVMQGLSFAFELVVDAVTLIVDEISFFSNAIREAYQEGSIFTAVVNGIGQTINFLGDSIKYILDELQKLYLGEDEYNKRVQQGIDANKQRAQAALDKKKKEEEEANALEERRKKTEKSTKATIDDKDATKAAEKALKDYIDTLKGSDKVIEDFAKRRKKLASDNLQGEDKINAQKQIDLDELALIAKNEDDKLALLQKKYKVGSKSYEEIQKRRNLISEAAGLEEMQFEVKYANEILDFRKKKLDENNALLQKELEDKAKFLSDAQKQKEQELSDSIAFINQQKDLRVEDIDLEIKQIEAKGQLGEKDKLQVQALNEDKINLQIAYLTQVRNLLADEKGNESPDVKLIDNQIKGLKIGLEKLKNDNTLLDPIAKFKKKIAATLGISGEDLDAIIGSVQQGIQAIGSIISQANQDQINENQKLIDSLKGRISETEAALKKEEELKAKGFANNVSGKTAELKALHDEEKKAEARSRAFKKEALKRQLAADLLSQASSTAVAAAGFFKANSPIPIVGAIIAAAGIASMIATIAKFQSERKALETQLYTGGSLSNYLEVGEANSGFVKKGGSPDSPGSGGRGYKIQGTNIRVGGNEFLLNERTSLINSDFLEQMNTGFYDKHGGVSAYFRKHQTPSLGLTIQRVEKIQKDTLLAQTNRNDSQLKEAILESADRQISYWKSRTERVSTSDGYIEFSKNGQTRVRVSE